MNTLLRTGVAGVLTGLSPAKMLPLAGLVGGEAAVMLARVGLLGVEDEGCAAIMLPMMGLVGMLADAALGSPVDIAEFARLLNIEPGGFGIAGGRPGCLAQGRCVFLVTNQIWQVLSTSIRL